MRWWFRAWWARSHEPVVYSSMALAVDELAIHQLWADKGFPAKLALVEPLGVEEEYYSTSTWTTFDTCTPSDLVVVYLGTVMQELK